MNARARAHAPPPLRGSASRAPLALEVPRAPSQQLRARRPRGAGWAGSAHLAVRVHHAHFGSLCRSQPGPRRVKHRVTGSRTRGDGARRLRHRRPPLGPGHLHGEALALLQHHGLPHGAAARRPAGRGQGARGELQGRHFTPRHHQGAAVLRQKAVRLGLPPRHGRPHEPDRQDVLPGAGGDGHHGLHAAVLQDRAGRGVLAVGEPVLQRPGELHQPQRRLAHHAQRAPPLVARWVPFAAVAAANCVNIPMMRQQEILNGIAITDENGNRLGHSQKAAVKGITQVVISRVTMAAPGMIILPIIMQRLEKYRFMQRITFLHGPLQVMMVGVFLVFMVPAACSLFPQRCSMAVSKLEPELRDAIVSQHGDAVRYVYFNKGL
ncbi:sideroflexin-2 isoform X1 [Scleropages formosus]|uniref:sideroflexin-2 isoform X1 n=1 Tax=Scleropages formosus TaxID=113540 RepID=UPI0010FABCD5|nr:sideroflexin-2 isoform X1 [Scleropages formosus]